MSKKDNSNTRDTTVCYLTFSTSTDARLGSLPTRKHRAKFTVRPTVKAGLNERQQMRNYGYSAATFEVRKGESENEVVTRGGIRIRVK